jgi:4-hydroxy-tetrahydrodipicolinate reductase
VEEDETEEDLSSTTLGVHAERIEDVSGTHSVKYTSAIDDIEIIHTAHSRAGFAYGAVLAAEWLQGKKGVFGMENVIKNQINL